MILPYLDKNKILNPKIAAYAKYNPNSNNMLPNSFQISYKKYNDVKKTSSSVFGENIKYKIYNNYIEPTLVYIFGR
jgi:hypothetical protein